MLLQAVSFVESRLYNAFLNNCIQNTDFLIRVLTGGAVRNAPLIFDALCGHVPPQDNPMLLMFMLMTRMSWYAILTFYLIFDSACSISVSVDPMLLHNVQTSAQFADVLHHLQSTD